MYLCMPIYLHLKLQYNTFIDHPNSNMSAFINKVIIYNFERTILRLLIVFLTQFQILIFAFKYIHIFIYKKKNTTLDTAWRNKITF